MMSLYKSVSTSDKECGQSTVSDCDTSTSHRQKMAKLQETLTFKNHVQILKILHVSRSGLYDSQKLNDAVVSNAFQDMNLAVQSDRVNGVFERTG